MLHCGELRGATKTRSEWSVHSAGREDAQGPEFLGQTMQFGELGLLLCTTSLNPSGKEIPKPGFYPHQYPSLGRKLVSVKCFEFLDRSTRETHSSFCFQSPPCCPSGSPQLLPGSGLGSHPFSQTTVYPHPPAHTHIYTVQPLSSAASAEPPGKCPPP